MRRIAIHTSKGGSAKTTTAHSLAAGLATLGHPVLLLDLDSQANLSQWLGIPADARTLAQAIVGECGLAQAVSATEIEGIDVIPGSRYLAGAAVALRSRPGGELWLRNQLGRLPADRWDFIIMDTAPGFDLLSVAALAAAGEVLSPVEPSSLGLQGLAQLLETVGEVRETINPSLHILGALPVRVDMRNRLTTEALEKLQSDLGETLFHSRVRINVKLAECVGHGETIFAYAPGSHGAEDYAAVTREVLERG